MRITGGPLLGIVLAVAGCTERSAPTAPAVHVASVVVTPSEATIGIRASIQLTATTRAADTSVLAGRAVTWISESPAIVTVTQAGLVTGLAAGGPVTISATSEGKTGTAMITVRAAMAAVASVTVTPAQPNVLVSRTWQLTATVKDAAGNFLPDRTVTWASSNTALATVTGTGLVTGASAGSDTITATSDGVSGRAILAVKPIFAAPALAVVDAGEAYACGVTPAGAVYCWGVNRSDQLGAQATDDCTGAQDCNPAAVAVSGTITFASVSASVGSGMGYHTCGLTPEGVAFCWGYNGQGQLGNGTTADGLTPLAVAGGLIFKSLSTGAQHTCGVTLDRKPYCWGDNEVGQLGNGSTTNSSTPVPVSGGLLFDMVSAGSVTTCGLTPDGAGYCWGFNRYGQFGNGQVSDIPPPSPVPVSGGLVFASLSAGVYHTCGVSRDGAAYCWGNNRLGQLGNNSYTDSYAPVAVGGGYAFGALTASNDHTCGITASAVAYCWGWNYNGALGTGSRTDSPTPVPVSGGLVFTSLTTGNSYSCGATGDGAAYCWGLGPNGQLGNGSNTGSTVPIKVVGQP